MVCRMRTSHRVRRGGLDPTEAEEILAMNRRLYQGSKREGESGSGIGGVDEHESLNQSRAGD
jgi:hypothetical protein